MNKYSLYLIALFSVVLIGCSDKDPQNFPPAGPTPPAVNAQGGDGINYPGINAQPAPVENRVEHLFATCEVIKEDARGDIHNPDIAANSNFNRIEIYAENSASNFGSVNIDLGNNHWHIFHDVNLNWNADGNDTPSLTIKLLNSTVNTNSEIKFFIKETAPNSGVSVGKVSFVSEFVENNVTVRERASLPVKCLIGQFCSAQVAR